jgi:parallel beta-helix repeat protein
MQSSRRYVLAISVVVLLAIVAAAGYWYQSQRTLPGRSSGGLTVNVTSGADRGAGSFREALFLVAAANEKATISIQVPRVTLESVLPPIVSAHGLRIVAKAPGSEIDAQALRGVAALDVAGSNISIEGLAIRRCNGAGILLRAVHFNLESTTIEGCDVGVDVAENASDVLLERNRFVGNRIGVRFAASAANTSVVKNEFSGSKDAGLWAVRSAPNERSTAINVRENRFSDDRIGMVVGNVAVLIERNELNNAQEAAVHLVGAGAIVRGNRINGGASMGVIAENARAAIIDDNEIAGLTAYGIMVRGSSNTLVRNNRLQTCGYGMAFVLNDPQSPSTAVENTVIEPKFNGIDVIGDSPILRRNHVLRPHALALKVLDFRKPGGETVVAKPFLDNNAFGTAGSAGTSTSATRESGSPTRTADAATPR